MDDSDRLAVAAHLHVALRRKTGRVTDTEWMASNQTYAQAMVTFAREHAREKADEELERLAARLAQSWGEPAPATKPSGQSPVTAATSESRLAERATDMLRTSARYIGGLR